MGSGSDAYGPPLAAATRDRKIAGLGLWFVKLPSNPEFYPGPETESVEINVEKPRLRGGEEIVQQGVQPDPDPIRDEAVADPRVGILKKKPRLLRSFEVMKSNETILALGDELDFRR